MWLIYYFHSNSKEFSFRMNKDSFVRILILFNIDWYSKGKRKTGAFAISTPLIMTLFHLAGVICYALRALVGLFRFLLKIKRIENSSQIGIHLPWMSKSNVWMFVAEFASKFGEISFTNYQKRKHSNGTTLFLYELLKILFIVRKRDHNFN